jgi:protein SCO1
MNKFLATVALIIALAVPSLSATELPSASVLQIQHTFTDQNGVDFKLPERAGKVQLVAMFYTSCRYICPLIIDSAKAVQHALSAPEAAKLSILLVSMDAARDTPATLMSVVKKRRLDPAIWTLARTDAAGVRVFAALLDMRYRVLADGEFNHTSALVLLDAQGRIIARTERLGSPPDPAFLVAVKRALTED